MNTYQIYILNYLNGSLKFIWSSGQILRRFGLVSFTQIIYLNQKSLNNLGLIQMVAFRPTYIYSEYT